MYIVRQLLLPLFAALLLLAACTDRTRTSAAADKASSGGELKKTKTEERFKSDFYAAADSSTTLTGNASPPEPQKNAAPVKKDWDKKIIKTATLTLEVKNYHAFNSLLHSSIKETGGYIAQEEQTQSEYKIENVVTIKVPVDQFENAIARTIPDSGKLVEKKITSEDVTTEVVDTKSRLEAKKMVRLRYLDLLKQAKNMQEILEVQNEINSIQEEEESATGRIQYLSHASAYSTIHLTFYQVLNATAAETPPDASFGKKIGEAFTLGLQWFGGVAITLITIWPLWLLLIIAWIIIKKYRGSVAKKP